MIMARQNLETDMGAFMSTLRQLGSAGNGALRDALGWAENRYWKAHAALFESGKIQKGRGRGGSVSTGASRAKAARASATRGKTTRTKPARKR
jgi:type I restriction enzyme M protein